MSVRLSAILVALLAALQLASSVLRAISGREFTCAEYVGRPGRCFDGAYVPGFDAGFYVGIALGLALAAAAVPVWRGRLRARPVLAIGVAVFVVYFLVGERA